MTKIKYLAMAVLSIAMPAAAPITANASTTLTTLAPNTIAMGSPTFTLTADGTGFDSASVVSFGGKALSTSFVSSTKVTASVPAADLTESHGLNVTVTTGTSTTNALTFDITETNPPPTISAISPTAANAGSGEFTLTVTGTHFDADAAVDFGGTLVQTTFVSSTQLTADIPASLIAKPGKAAVYVRDLDGQGWTLNGPTFTIASDGPPPTLGSIAPTSVLAGAAAFTLTITGTNFVSSSKIHFGGLILTTDYVSSTKLTANVPAGAVAKVGDFDVYVTDDNGEGWTQSSPFQVMPAAGPPAISSLDPSTAVAGGDAFPMTVSGSNFLKTSTVYFNGLELATTFVSSTELTAQVAASNIAKPGNVNVYVKSNNGDGVSKSTAFDIMSADPGASLSGISPASVPAGSPDFMLMVFGTDFTGNTQVVLGKTVLDTNYADSMTLVADVPASLVAKAQTLQVTLVGTNSVNTRSIQFTIGPNPAQLTYEIGNTGSSGNADGIGISYYVKPSQSLDFTQPAEFNVVIPATKTSQMVTMYDTGSVALTSTVGTDAAGNSLTYYTFKDGNLDFSVLPLGGGQYAASISANGLQFPTVDLATPVVITLTLGGQTFKSNVTPHVVEGSSTSK